MKKYLLFPVALLCLLAGPASAQKDGSGVYMSAADFTNGKPQYAINCNAQSHKIKSDVFFKKKTVVVKHEGGTYKLNKNGVYAVRYCNGSVVRLFMGKQYPMLNAGEPILLYKIVTAPAGKTPATTACYFSKDAASPIQILTKTNLKTAFPDNHSFHDLVEAELSNDSDLTKYDDIHKMYRINRLYLNALEKK